jgi:hypothetical protein
VTPVEVVRRLWLAYAARGVDGVFEHAWEDGSWRSALANFREVRGRDALRTLFEQVEQQGMSLTALPYDYSEVGGQVVVAVDVMTRHGGEEHINELFLLFCLDDGKVRTVTTYLSFDQACKAAAG